jgi:L-histidine N-alpha-methyltransferase
LIKTSQPFDEAVANAVLEGLQKIPKSLPSWLFYDEVGDAVFQQIMRTPEYYPTRCEYDILQEHKDDLLNHFDSDAPSFSLIELGAGDGLKTEILLEHFLRKGAQFTYLPVDISANALQLLSGWLTRKYPELNIHTMNKSYDDALLGLRDQAGKKVLLFMGANIGNFSMPEASAFMTTIAGHLCKSDLILIGFDLKKDPRIIQEAYDDPHGLTRQFNLNLLTRLNRELDADFVLANFSHYPYYDPESGTAKSFLISMKQQSVHMLAPRSTVHFKRWEPIQTEVSQKYEVPVIENLLGRSGLKAVNFYFDPQRYFCDVLASLS